MTQTLFDPFRHALDDLQIRGSVLLYDRLRWPWAIRFADHTDLRKRLGADQHNRILVLHLVLDGQCDLATPESAVEGIAAGELLLLSDGTEHVVGNGKPLRTYAFDDERLGMGISDQAPRFGDGATTILSCAFALAAAPLNPILAEVPPILRMVVDDSSKLNRITKLVVEEVSSEGSKGYSVARLLEVLLAEILAAHCRTLRTRVGWARVIDDEKLRTALAAFHERPDRPWTAGALAKEASLSISRFGERFYDKAGFSPIAYVAKWRMNLACRYLRESNESVAQIAERVGYTDMAAFRRTFELHLGTLPSEWRSRLHSRHS